VEIDPRAPARCQQQGSVGSRGDERNVSLREMGSVVFPCPPDDDRRPSAPAQPHRGVAPAITPRRLGEYSGHVGQRKKLTRCYQHFRPIRRVGGTLSAWSGVLRRGGRGCTIFDGDGWIGPALIRRAASDIASCAEGWVAEEARQRCCIGGVRHPKPGGRRPTPSTCGQTRNTHSVRLGDKCLRVGSESARASIRHLETEAST